MRYTDLQTGPGTSIRLLSLVTVHRPKPGLPQPDNSVRNERNVLVILIIQILIYGIDVLVTKYIK